MMSSGMCSLGRCFLVASPKREELVVGRVGRGKEGGREVGCSREYRKSGTMGTAGTGGQRVQTGGHPPTTVSRVLSRTRAR